MMCAVFTPEKELDFSAPLLNPLNGNSSNRISSSIIRELSSDMVIPYCRLNLLDCIGQGKYMDPNTCSVHCYSCHTLLATRGVL